MSARSHHYKYWSKHVAGHNKYTAALDREQEG